MNPNCISDTQMKLQQIFVTPQISLTALGFGRSLLSGQFQATRSVISMALLFTFCRIFGRSETKEFLKTDTLQLRVWQLTPRRTLISTNGLCRHQGNRVPSARDRWRRLTTTTSNFKQFGKPRRTNLRRNPGGRGLQMLLC